MNHLPKEIRTIDYHTGGEPLRIIISGFPPLSSKKILDQIEELKTHYDQFRTFLIHEPRGHYDMYACLPVENELPDSKCGLIFLHNEGYSSMCGHAIIAYSTYLFESGQLNAEEKKSGIVLDVPAGQVKVNFELNEEELTVSFQNVPSYVLSLGNRVKLKNEIEIEYDLAFGGAYYAYVSSKYLKADISKTNISEIRALGMKIKKKISESAEINHPEDPRLSFLYGVIFVQEKEGKRHSQNVCVFANGEIDRSPTGTGVSGRAAIHYSRKEIQIGQSIQIESITGANFEVLVKEEIDYFGFHAVIPIIKGRAFKTGDHKFILDSNDPQGLGFLLS